ncbi:DUF2332 domain-containing protein [Pseudodonghicola xiamenensis]|uniref:DUF2332 domain-containing protein n=1 Tax=Pseudodonghicola xiamenensis TaxID=337702 RepID=A0A8J3H945_9RHOB|nr:DUF2332 family protein [Pseudodonghicola xiamenensis]GHG92123.1 hypothetical protein GCM10010961_23840 [Pseudodonghicola xiamenensis]
MRMPPVLRAQARACANLDSPFMARLLTGLADRWPAGSALGQLCEGWEDVDLGPSGASLPLRIAGGLHALVLRDEDADLAAVYPPHQVADAALIDTVLAAIERHQAFFADWMKNAPQTNEVRRAAVLIAAAHEIAARHPLPFAVSELGASGGLNLMFDRFALKTPAGRLGPDAPALTLSPEWDGPFPAPAPFTVADRRGVDLNPLDPHDTADALRLSAYLWADQPHRLELTRAAIAAQAAPVDRSDAIDWLAARLEMPRPGQLHLIYHTVAWQYFPAAAQTRGRALIEAAGTRASSDSPLAWLGMEADGGTGAAITLRLWPGDITLTLGRADFHGRWIRWTGL